MSDQVPMVISFVFDHLSGLYRVCLKLELAQRETIQESHELLYDQIWELLPDPADHIVRFLNNLKQKS